MELIDAYATVIEILEESGPLSDGELVGRLRKAGLTEAQVKEVVVEYPHELTALVDEHKWVSLPWLLAPRRLTHRLSAAEMALDVVCIGIDWLAAAPILDVLGELADHTEFYVAQAETVIDVLSGRDREQVAALPHFELLVLPVGYLDGIGAAAGGLLSLRFSREGPALEPVSDDQVGDGRPVVDAITPLLGHEPIDVDQMVWDLLATDPSLLASPQPPLSEILEVAGAARYEALVAAPGVDIEVLLRERRIGGIARTHGLSRRDAEDVLTLVEHHDFLSYIFDLAADEEDDGEDDDPPDDVDDPPDPEGPGEAGQEPGAAGLAAHKDEVERASAVLAVPAAAEALLGECAGIGTEGLGPLGALAESLEERAPKAARASLRWLRAKAHERLGFALEAEEDLHAALALDPDHPLALEELGGFLSDRGDAEQALRLLRRAGVPAHDDLLTVLEEHRAKTPAKVGRNDPCWCGSGRKRKHCHRDGGPSLPLERRTSWMLAKTAMYLQEGPHRGFILDLAMARAEHMPDGAVFDALGEAVVLDVAMAEGGLYDAFLAARGPLLPDDERLTFEQWALVERSLFDVKEVQPAEGLVLRDVRTGDRLTVTEHTASPGLRVGDLICTRVVPVGSELQLVGGVEPVSLGQRETLIELLDDPDPVELIAFLSARFAPPQIQNTEGEHIVDCAASIRVPDPAALAVALDERFDRHDGAESRWTENVVTMGLPRVRSEVTIDGDVATMIANSNERADRTLALILELAPGAQVLSDERTVLGRHLDEILAAAPPRTDGAEVLDPNDPLVQDALRAFVRQSEDAWVDESIPALGGITPREAAADPTRRDDVIRLLDTFPKVPPGGAAMDPDRLRQLLDL